MLTKIYRNSLNMGSLDPHVTVCDCRPQCTMQLKAQWRNVFISGENSLLAQFISKWADIFRKFSNHLDVQMDDDSNKISITSRELKNCKKLNFNFSLLLASCSHKRLYKF